LFIVLAFAGDSTITSDLPLASALAEGEAGFEFVFAIVFMFSHAIYCGVKEMRNKDAEANCQEKQFPPAYFILIIDYL